MCSQSFRHLLLALIIGITPWFVTPVQAHGVTLVVHHYLPADSAFHTQFLIPWTQKLEKESAGLLRFRFFPAMQLGGDPAKLAEQVTDRTADIVLALTRHTPGRFPAIEAFEVTPFKHHARGASRAAWEYVRLNDLAEKEFDETRLLAVAVWVSSSARAGSDVGLLLMNTRSYKALSEELRKVVTANSGAETSVRLASVLDEETTDSPSPSQEAFDNWTKRATERGVNADALAQSARELMAEYDTH